MSLSKMSIVLLALLLAAMTMVPFVSATERNAIGQTNSTWKYAAPEHYLPPEYFKDAKPVTPLPESEMINIVFSEKTLDSFNQVKQAGIITIPAFSLNANSQFTESRTSQNRFVENGINPNDVVVLVRMPRSMYDRFLATSRDGVISLPASYFSRYYKNLAELDSNVHPDGNAVTITPSKDTVLAEKTNVSVTVKKKPVVSNPLASRIITPMRTSQGANTSHNKWIFFNRTYADTLDYCIGQITPDSWSVSGNNDRYYAPQEREYYLNYEQDAIEIIVNYDHYSYWPESRISLFPAIYDNHASAPTPLEDNRYESKGPGIMALDPATFPRAFGYHVQISNGKYYIAFEFMNNLTFTSNYIYDDQDNPSTSFTRFGGSSEFRQVSSLITDSFSASTTPVIDQWTHDATLNSWRKPADAWEYNQAVTDEIFTNIYWFVGGSNSNEYGTSSYMSSAWT
nr:hypothetical protein [uncultured Methanoregula sp.]